MSHEFRIVISPSANPAGAMDPVSAFEKIEPPAGSFTAATTVLAGAVDRLAEAAAATPAASLESLAAAARQAQANAVAAGQPMAGLADAPDDSLARVETGFGLDFQGKIIPGVEEIGRAFTETLQRGLEPVAGRQPAAVSPGASSPEDRSAGFAGPAAGLPLRPEASADALERRHGGRRDMPDDPGTGHDPAGAPPLTERRSDAQPATPKHPDTRAARHPGLPREHTQRRAARATFTIRGFQGDGDPAGGLHTGGLTTGSLGGVGTSTAASVLAGARGAADRLAGGRGSFATAPTAAAGLGPALAGIGAGQPAVAPGAPADGQAGAVGPAVDKAGAAAGRGFEEATRAVDRLQATLSKGFQTLNERIERVEQATREHTSQIGNRA